MTPTDPAAWNFAFVALCWVCACLASAVAGHFVGLIVMPKRRNRRRVPFSIEF